MTKKRYQIPNDLEVNIGSWNTDLIGADYTLGISSSATYPAGVFDIEMPIHPDYICALKPDIVVGDLVETYKGDLGVIVSEEIPQGMFLQVKGANNKYYTVLINEEEKKFIGYSLKKIKK